MNTVKQNIRKGFTLLEVLVSTAIMVIIVLTVVSIASDSLRVYDRAVADLSSQSEARGVLDAMENDFSTAVLRSDGRCWMEIIIPGGTGAPSAVTKVGNIDEIDQPVVMLFSTPQDRPRWSAETTRRQLRGDVCAVAYRIGQRSPFDMPGDPIQQVYGVYRTIIDPENTFAEALPVILDGPVSSSMQTPWDYWSASRSYTEYAPLDSASPGVKKKVLFDIPSKSSWTMDEQNFIGSNVVALNLVLWCSSSLPAQNATINDPVKRVDSALRPVFPAASDQTLKYNVNPLIGGYGVAFKSATTAATIALAPIRYAETGTPTAVTPGGVHPKDYYFGRLRVFSNRMYPDALPLGAPASAAPFNYMPYTIRGVEVSVTVLTPDGSKELRGLQDINKATTVPEADFKRIVYIYGRNYTRYIRVLANGG
jgi:prepilin-type N-terminal cleavage/methylation domain-containing protein